MTEEDSQYEIAQSEDYQNKPFNEIATISSIT